MKDIIKKKWFQVWCSLIIASPIVSFVGSYGYLYVLALLYPSAQLIGIKQIEKSKLNLIWLLHFPFWIYVLSLDLDRNGFLISIVLNSILGELLLTIIFRKFGRFTWFILNLFAFAIISVGMFISGGNDFIQIIVLIISFGIAAIILGVGLNFGYLNEKKTEI